MDARAQTDYGSVVNAASTKMLLCLMALFTGLLGTEASARVTAPPGVSASVAVPGGGRQAAQIPTFSVSRPVIVAKLRAPERAATGGWQRNVPAALSPVARFDRAHQ